MKTPRMLCIGLFWVVGAWAAEGCSTYPLKPVLQTERHSERAGSRLINAGKDGEGEMPFTTASGKLRLKKTGDNILVGWDEDGKFPEPLRDKNGLIAVKVPVKLAGKAFEYPISLFPIKGPPSDEYNQLVFVNGHVHLEAHVGRTVVRLYDTNLNGRFGDPGDNLQIGENGSARAITKYVEVDGKIRELEIVNDGEALNLLPYAGPKATLKLNAKEGWNTEVQLTHTEGLFVAFPKCSETILIPGAYRLGATRAQFGEKKTEDGSDQYPVWFYSSPSKDAPIQVREGANSLAFGPPFRFEFAAARSTADAAEVIISDAYLTGVGGEKYRANNYGSNGESTLTCFVRSAGKEQEVAKLSYG